MLLIGYLKSFQELITFLTFQLDKTDFFVCASLFLDCDSARNGHFLLSVYTEDG